MTNPGFKRLVNCSVFTLLPLAAAVQAQESSNTPVLENIVVTAQRTEENIQNTPITMSALSSADVERFQIDNAKDIGQVTPNVNIKGVTGGSAGITPFIRGGGVTDGANITSEAEVGIYIDDVYQPRSASSFIESMDIERIEVLRGPQGTLYGRNSSAGALKFVSRLPSEEFSLKNEVGVGRWNEVYDKINVSGALSDDGKLRGGLTGMYRDRDGGRQENLTTGQDVGAETYKGAQTDLYYEGDTIEARWKTYYTDYDSDGLYTSSLDPNQMTGSYKDYPFYSGSIDKVLSPYQSYTSDKQYGTSLHLSTDLNDAVTFKSITAYNKLKNDWAVGFSGGVANADFGLPSDGYIELYGRESVSDQENFSQEFQLSGDAFGGFLSYVGGVYYFRETGTQKIDTEVFLAPAYAEFSITTDSYAAFGQANLSVTDDISVILGARYTEDKKSLDAEIAGGAVDESDTFSKFTPKIGVEYQATDNMFLYASYTEGFKAGGYNGLAETVEALSTPFDMQEVSAYEIGMKSDWWDQRLRLNLAAFFNDYTNLQQQSVTDTGTFITVNYDAEHKGLEAELSMMLTDDLFVWANGVVQDSEYTGTSTANSATSLVGNSMTNVFENQVAVGFDYTREIGPGTLGFGANMNHRADFFSTADNAEIGHVKPISLVDAYLSYSVDRWKVTLSGKNLTDEKYWFTGFGFSVVQPRFMSDPLTWRLSAAYEF